MTALAVLAAITLAVLLVWAAIAKLLHPGQTSDAFTELGLPAPGLLSKLVPLIELAVALTLLFIPAAGGIAAFGLLAAFTAVLIAVLRSGAVVNCNCFGATSHGEVRWFHVLRNGLMLVLAALASTLPIGWAWYLWTV